MKTIFDKKTIKHLADMLRAGKTITIREVPNGICHQIEINHCIGAGATTEEAIEQALAALND